MLAAHVDVDGLDGFGIPDDLRVAAEVAAADSVKRVARRPRGTTDAAVRLARRPRRRAPRVDRGLPRDEDRLAPDRRLRREAAVIVVAGEALVDVIARRDGVDRRRAGRRSVQHGAGDRTARRPRRVRRRPVRRRARATRWPDRSPPTACRSTSSSAPTCRRRGRSRSSTIAARRATGSTWWERRPRRSTRARCSPRSRPTSPRCTSGPSGLVFEPIAGHDRGARRRRSADDAILVVDPNCRPSAIADPAGLPRAPRPDPRPRRHREGLDGRPVVPGVARSTAPVVVVTDAGGPVRVRARRRGRTRSRSRRWTSSTPSGRGTRSAARCSRGWSTPASTAGDRRRTRRSSSRRSGSPSRAASIVVPAPRRRPADPRRARRLVAARPRRVCNEVSVLTECSERD